MLNVDLQQPVWSIGPRYLIENLVGQGGMGAVYKAFDRLTGQMVALKHVTLQKEDLEFATKATDTDIEVALAQEFKTLATLRHPHIISVLDYGFDSNKQPYFTMELLENAQNILEYGQPLPQDEQIQLLVQVLQALAYLHRRGIIHRDLKPDNVMVIDGQVKVLDFGLAIAQGYMRDNNETVSGTLAYMAPEVLQGHAATIESDLYAVGIMAYEMFTGRFPFTLNNVNALINDIVFTVPDVESLGLGPVLQQAVTRLLMKNPADRPHDARELIALYAEATDQKLKYESSIIRDSYIQAARFVGRESEMAVLSQAIEEACKGRGGVYLIGGESGVGKSRLSEELRTVAMVRGMLTVHAGGVSDGSIPYALWREPLRRLVLEMDIDINIASILKPLVSDIDTLLGHTIPPATDLDPQAAQDRLFNTIETLLQQQTRPVAIFLDDLQWAGSESIQLLDRLGDLTDTSTIIIGNFRDDEVAGLPQQIKHNRLIKLERLDEDNIQRLSVSMLGEAGRRFEVVDLLQRETEGNIFFIVEVVRALAEEVGQLDLIGQVSLPDSIFAGGIQKIIQRRLQKIPQAAFPLLRLAAVIGRQIDTRLLKALHDDFDQNEWLTACSDAAVLEVQDGRWRFAHDKLREAILKDSGSTRREDLHQQVAEAIETVYEDNLAPYYAMLAHHWSKTQQKDRAIKYLDKAGTQAIENFANQEALTFFQNALQLAHDTEPLQLARWHRQIAHAYWGLGNLAALRQHVETALRIHKRPIPENSRQLALSLIKQTGVQVWHRLHLPATTSINEEVALEIVRAYKLLGQAYFFLNESMLTVYVTLHEVNLAERIPPSPELAEAYANTCLVTGLIPLHSLAKTYQRLSLKTVTALQDTYMRGQVSSVISLYYMGIGEWQTARYFVNESITVAGDIGDQRLWESVSGVLALINNYQGDFSKAMEVFSAVYNSSRRSGNTQTLLWGMLGRAENLLPAGKLSEAWVFLEQAMTLPIGNFGNDSEIRTYALVALVQFRMGHQQQALEAASKVMALITKAPPSSSWLLQHYAAVAEIYFTLWEKEGDTFREQAQRAAKAITGFAKVFPIGKARAGLYQGWSACLSGKPDRAQQTWDRAIEAAQTLGMPYDQALLHYEAGRHLPLDHAARQVHLERAFQMFHDLNASFAAEHAASQLSSGSS